jgi:hypothetical protein
MRQFASTHYRLSEAPRWQKVLYSAFLAFMLIGLGTNLAFGMTKTGLTSRAIADYYLGNPNRLMFEKTFQELLEVTHVHAFMMPMVLLVLGHLFLLTAWPARRKRAVIVVAAVSTLLDLAAPWAIRYGHGAFAHVKLAAGYCLGGSWLCMIGAPLYEMWCHARS